MIKFKVLFTLLLLNTSIAMSQKYETQEYKIVDQVDKVEIRYYPSAAMIKVSADMGRNNNFGKLFRYIAGGNKSDEKIAMTTPVYMSNDNRTMEFVLPRKFISNDAPVPIDSDVETYISEPRYFAAIRYSGYSNERKEREYKEQLIKTIEESKLKMI
ncbi:heme-binding protein, partial [Flavobacteriaceae bacterium]|nr:heme-binding protein [Flavobacteriaceae bacterium]